jgi:hypothetical protein
MPTPVRAALVICALAFVCAAQTNVRPQTTPPVNASAQEQTSVNEDFELNIGERRITERDFFASTSVAAGDEQAQGLSLRIGVAVGAESIDVLLRNVRGRVRFRATLAPLLRVIEARRAAPPAGTRPVP